LAIKKKQKTTIGLVVLKYSNRKRKIFSHRSLLFHH
jgi:hypothetical protein